MPYAERKELYRQIEEHRGRPLIAYITSSRQGAAGMMASDVVPELTRQIKKIPSDATDVDFFIVSRGGDPTVSWRIISLLRERFRKVGVVLPYEAFSAATLIALGADEIVMHPFANLGPVDPQLSYKKDGTGDVVNFGAEDLRHFFDFVKEDVGISDQEQLQRAFEMVGKDIGAIPIGSAKRGAQLSLTMGEKLLNLHMNDQSKVKAIAESLNKSFYHHGYPVGKTEAKEIGLPIKNPGVIEDLMWNIWLDIEDEMECCTPFNPIHLVMADPTAAALLGPTPVANIPADLPPQLLQNAYQQVLSSIQVTAIPPVDYELFHATAESPRCRSEFRARGRIFTTKRADLKIDVSLVPTASGWYYIEEDEAPPEGGEGQEDATV